jgi:hypothetical protein
LSAAAGTTTYLIVTDGPALPAKSVAEKVYVLLPGFDVSSVTVNAPVFSVPGALYVMGPHVATPEASSPHEKLAVTIEPTAYLFAFPCSVGAGKSVGPVRVGATVSTFTGTVKNEVAHPPFPTD